MKLILTALMLLAGTAAAQAQYQSTDKLRDHTWIPDNPNMSNVSTSAPGIGTSAQSWSPPVQEAAKDPVTPKEETATGTWKYQHDGRVWLQGTRGFAVVGASLGCYDNRTNASGNNAICGPMPNAVGSCIFNGYGVGNCTSGIPFTGQFQQQSYTADTSWFWG